ncbi:MAG: starch-binding protein [Muribaculaceae bacterium]|nr:starch-binding protein [Muribaculaceae bacterium]
MKRLLSVAALSWMLCSSAFSADYGLPANIQDGNILHCFDWTFTDIQKELPNIAAAGFGAIQVSPVQGNCANNAEWFYAYMPYDFTFRANGNGSRAQLQALCTAAKQYGIKIVVDVVANHVNQAKGYHDTWWDSNGRVRWNGGCDYNNRYSITHNQLGEYGDVNSEDAQVQARAKAFIEDLKSLGVAGIRWDAAKHIGLPSESCNFWSQMASVNGLWHYGEILDGPGGDKYRLLKEYTKYIGVTDSEYSKWTLEQVERGDVPSGGGSWTANGVPSTGIVYWAESHDDYSNDGQYGKNTALISQDKMDRAYAITACRKGEAALYFSRPAATTRTTIKMGQKGSTHFTAKEVAEVNKFRNAMVGLDDYYSASNGVACVTRKGGGAVIVVGAGGSRQVNVPNGGSFVPAGTYVDKVSGNSFTVTSSTISGKTGSSGIAVIYGEVTHEPSVTLSPDGGDFYESVNVTLTPKDYKTAWYKIGNGAQTNLTGPTTITLGADLQIGQSVTLSWSATDEKGVTKTGSATYKKVEKVIPTNAYAYFDNTANWNEVYVWAWNTTENCTSSGTWPGDKLTKGADGKYLWTAPDGKVPTQIIFSGGDDATKTADLIFKNGATYKADGSFSGGGGDDPFPPTPGMDGYKVFLKNTHNWAQPYVWAWNDTANCTHGGTWPGDKMTREADGTWSWSAPDGKIPTQIIFNGGGDDTKTSDLPYRNFAIYSCDGSYVDNPLTVVDAIEIADEAPVYFNLQGVRVDNPGAGLYIKVTGKKVEKVIIR